MWKEKLALYDELVAKCPRFERKGKTGPYTSANGHMFSFLNKDGELGFRYSKEVQEKYIQSSLLLDRKPFEQRSFFSRLKENCALIVGPLL